MSNMLMPKEKYFEYFSHLYHSQSLVPINNWSSGADWTFSERESYRQNKLFQTDGSYFTDQRVIDLGCHHGYHCYIAKTLGAQSVHGVNARQWPLDVANFAFDQLHQDSYSFKQGNLENNEFLKKELVDKDTVIFTEVLEHLRNPYAIFETITNSDVKNLVFQCSVGTDQTEPIVTYYKQSTQSNFSVYDEDRKVGIGSLPNLSWLTMILYHLGWKIEMLDQSSLLNKDWFGTPNLENFSPIHLPSVIILAKKFKNDIGKNNFED